MNAIWRVLGWIVVALVALTGCSLSAKTPLSEANAKRIARIRVIVNTPSNQLYARTVPAQVAGSGAGGLLFTLVDVAVDHNRVAMADAAVRPFRDALADFDFRRHFVESLSDASVLPETDKIDAITLESRPNSELLSHYKSADESGLLIISPEYYFTPGLRAVEMAAEIKLYVVSDLNGNYSAGTPEPVYRSRVMFQSEVIADHQDPVEYWLADSGQRFQTLVTTGTGKLAALAAMELGQLRSNGGKGDPAVWTLASSNSSYRTRQEGVVLGTDGDWDVARFSSGELASLPTSSRFSPLVATQ